MRAHDAGAGHGKQPTLPVPQVLCVLLASEGRVHIMQVLGMVNNPHYLYRMTILVAIASLAPVVSNDVLCHNMLPVVVSCSKDKVCVFRLWSSRVDWKPILAYAARKLWAGSGWDLLYKC